jgi:hypothetical protein
MAVTWQVDFSGRGFDGRIICLLASYLLQKGGSIGVEQAAVWRSDNSIYE